MDDYRNIEMEQPLEGLETSSLSEPSYLREPESLSEPDSKREPQDPSEHFHCAH